MVFFLLESLLHSFVHTHTLLNCIRIYLLNVEPFRDAKIYLFLLPFQSLISHYTSMLLHRIIIFSRSLLGVSVRVHVYVWALGRYEVYFQNGIQDQHKTNRISTSDAICALKTYNHLDFHSVRYYSCFFSLVWSNNTQ